MDFTNPVFSIPTQAGLLDLNRTSLYDKPHPSSGWNLQLNRLINTAYTKHSEFRYRRTTAWLDIHYSFHAGEKTVLCRMQLMGIQAIYPKQNTSKANPANKVHPYLFHEIQAPFAYYVMKQFPF